MSRGKKKKDITKDEWKLIQMTLNVKEVESPFRKMPLEDYLTIRALLAEGKYYVCAKDPADQVIQSISGLADANTGEVIDTDNEGAAICGEDDDHPILQEDDLYDFECEYVNI